MNYLTIKNDVIVVETEDETFEIYNMGHWANFVANHCKGTVYKSSCIDFPEDSTADQDTIALANAITKRSEMTANKGDN